MFKNYQTDRCYIIAEIGGNFTKYEQAERLIDEAKKCGVDAVKLQTFRAETISSREATFDMENTGITSQYDLFKKYELDVYLHKQILLYAEAKGLDCFSTPSHQTDVDMLEKLNVGAHKIGSDDAVNLPFLRYVARTGKSVFLSTGMCTLEEVRESVSTVLAEGNNRLILLHAITSYPTYPADVNLAAMQSLMRAFPELDIGFSDHTLTPVACLCAVAMGARVIEKHLTYDKKADGPDHMLSADPAEMRWLVDSVRSFEIMRGSGLKQPAKGEKTSRRNNRKSIVLNNTVKAGKRLTAEDLAIKRPGYGLGPKYLDQLIGRALAMDMKKDAVLTWKDLA